MKIFRNRTVIGVLCILLALIICFGVTPLFSRSASEKTEIVRVTKDIKEGDEITAEMVQTVEVGAYNLPQNLMTDKKEVIGKYATADLATGDYILSSKLSAVPAAENAYLYNLDGTKQAISVTIKSFATGLSGKLESGDIVTVIVADYQGKGETAIPPELQYVEVISVTASSGYDANTGEVVDEKELPSTVTLLVTTEQAKTLAKSIVCSNLTKTAIAGHDANWGRILCAMGYSGAQFDPEKVDLFFASKAGKIQIIENGTAVDYSEAEATKILSETEVTAIADVKMGDKTATAWGCDLTHGYIEINADYRS